MHNVSSSPVERSPKSIYENKHNLFSRVWQTCALHQTLTNWREIDKYTKLTIQIQIRIKFEKKKIYIPKKGKSPTRGAVLERRGANIDRWKAKPSAAL